MFKTLLLWGILSLFPLSALADPGDYEAYISDIENRLDRTMQAYADNDIETAKRTVQMAYFEVFENLEGPIRINISAKKSAEMEAAFGEIRRMIIQNQSAEEITARVDWLRQQLREVQAAIESGHRLVGEGAHGVFDNAKIATYWQEYFRLIEDLLAEGLEHYQEGKYPEASAKIQEAQFAGFKNSEMEIAIRLNRSSKLTQTLNQQFSALQTLAASPEQLTALSYQITVLLQDIEETLEELPAPVQANVMADDGADDTDWFKVSRDIKAAIGAALSLYEQGQTQQAIGAVQDAYFDLFEASGMENRIGARDSNTKTTLEAYFTRINALMKAGRSGTEIQQQVDALTQALNNAAETLGSGSKGFWGLALMSLIIILREGLEALLIVTAIVAYLVKSGHQDKLPLIRQSVIVALVASVLTAVVFVWLSDQVSGAQRELLEGFTMLIAVVILFGMSYWLLAKAEATRWKAYVEGKLAASLNKGSLFGLWFASFLAVYREGAETVLFYHVLLADAASSTDKMALLAGFLIGCVLLLIAYLLVRFSMAKLPLKPFFIVTGSFMYLMAFVFAGKGVMELIEGKLFQPTLLPWMPEISYIGIHPYVETTLPQAALIIAAVVALLVLNFRRPESSAAG